MDTELMFSSKTDQWATPQNFFDELNKEFNFTLDPCGDIYNHKCEKYFTKEENGLLKDWGGEIVFCNPPYGNKETGDWTKNATKNLLKITQLLFCLFQPEQIVYLFTNIFMGKQK